ncbi:hypothetical protein [Halorussus sp. MSC15.2]|uniref:hypothetical protein n=1 Tax=Halorussus sp. MSC15.2 TaxID=2283638 RepID=UPI0013D7E4FB|nr:hypothetical protein [Halorussus sp. MSC15.2]NEU56735.1 hypothetical protein [Halorussus sp. MSC15.2]
MSVEDVTSNARSDTCNHENVRRFGRPDAVGNPVIERQCTDCGAYLDMEAEE